MLTVVVPFQGNDGKAEVYFKRLRFCMAALAPQDCDRVLVDYASLERFVPELGRLAEEFGFRLVRCEPPGGLMARHGRAWNRARALNAGVRAARGDLVAFVDADCVVAPDYVERHEEAHTAAFSARRLVATFSYVMDTTEKVRPGGFAEVHAQGAGVLAGVRAAGFSHMCVPVGWFGVNGPMDERYVGWGAEDDDLWRRLMRAGVKRQEVKCQGGVSVFHLWHPPWTSMVKGGVEMVQRNRKILRHSYAVRWGLLTLDPAGAPRVNLGNRLIEYAVREALGLGQPAVTVTMFAPISDQDRARLNTCKFVLAPGSTILANARGNSEAMGSIKRLKVPVFAFGASGWGPKHPPHLAAIKALAGPIGCRDPQILEVCRTQGVKARLVGCPTMLLPWVPRIPEVSYWIAGFGRRDLPAQLAVLRAVKERLGHLKAVAAVQEPHHERAAAVSLGGHVFDYSDPPSVVRRYGECELVVTGRLHGVLPAMSQRRPVWFAGDAADSRFTLLQYAGVAIHRVGEPVDLNGLQGPDVYGHAIEEFRQATLDWKSETIDRQT